MRASREGRADRLAERAKKARARSNSALAASDKIAERFYMGQPILVGHHSEKGARKDHERCDNLIRRSIAESDKADDLDRRAEAAANNTAIYADDEDPVAELDRQIAKLEALQDRMKKANVLLRKLAAGDTSVRAALVELLGEKLFAKVTTPVPGYNPWFESFHLSNNSANIRRLKLRREQLAAMKASPRVERMVGEVKVIEDPDIARIQLVYPGKPDEATRAKLKALGFRWAPSEGAWQRQLNNAGRAAAEKVLG